MDGSLPAEQVKAALQALPSVDQLLRHAAVAPLLEDQPRGEVVHAVRAVLEEQRRALLAGRVGETDAVLLARGIRERLYERRRPRLRKVINATGIVLHTNLGRAPLAEEAVDALVEVAAGYCNLEYDLATGRRGSRHDHLRELLQELTGAEDALVVNNNAGATFLALSALAAGSEVIVSRGQLVEIGGSYRLPDIMAAAQCKLVEVGTTNRTRIGDYERAITSQTRVLLRVHTSNYRIYGFTESASLAELVDLARRFDLLVVDDLGSGLLTTELPWPQPATETAEEDEAGEAEEVEENGEPEVATDPSGWDEPPVRASLEGGADLALFSGDKLLGGPQAGIVVGRASLISQLRKHPLTRALRPDKLTLAALEATLRLYRDPEAVAQRVPVYRLLARSGDELSQAAEALAAQIHTAMPDAQLDLVPDVSEAGGGSLPMHPFPTWVVEVRTAMPTGDLAAALRRQTVPIICRIRDDALVFDPRTLLDGEAEQIAGALAEIVREAREE